MAAATGAVAAMPTMPHPGTAVKEAEFSSVCRIKRKSSSALAGGEATPGRTRGTRHRFVSDMGIEIRPACHIVKYFVTQRTTVDAGGFQQIPRCARVMLLTSGQ